MRRQNVNDLLAFIAVAREQSFTRAAARLGVSQSALSYTIRTLEERLGLRVLTRTTRSVALTQAGERLLGSIGPRFDEIERDIQALGEMRDKPAGTVRINSVEHAAETILWPAMARLLPQYPDVNVEIISDYGLIDIVAERYDAGVRLGEQVDKDMIAMRIGPDFQQAVVGAPAYFEGRTFPDTPQELTEHQCINLRLPTHGGFYVWEFRNNGRELNARVQGRAVFNSISLMRQAALDGLGLAYLPLDVVEADISTGRLLRVMDDWCIPRPGYHLYYPSRRQPSPAFALVLEALRYRSPTLHPQRIPPTKSINARSGAGVRRRPG
jgi:DNA-binding transcriptional LysR family regulator